MYQRLKALFKAGRINETQLDAAVSRGWITEEEATSIKDA